MWSDVGRFGVLLVGFGRILGLDLVKIRWEFGVYLMKLCIKWGLEGFNFGMDMVGMNS